MKYTAGLLGVACACMVMLVEGLVARKATAKNNGGECNLKALAALTKHLMQESSTGFDKANGKHLGTWSPGFPELDFDANSPLSGPKVQCSLSFMAEGLGKILEDQKNNLNPTDVSLQKKLIHTIATVKILKNCVGHYYKGKCPENPPPPDMPRHVFERKQWSHTLLLSAKHYLEWLQHKTRVLKSGEIRQKKFYVKNSPLDKYLEGSAHLL